MEMDEVPTYTSDEETSVNELVNSENKKRVKQRQRKLGEGNGVQQCP